MYPVRAARGAALGRNRGPSWSCGYLYTWQRVYLATAGVRRSARKWAVEDGRRIDVSVDVSGHAEESTIAGACQKMKSACPVCPVCKCM